MYVDTLQRLDSALTSVCRDFDPQRYSTLLEGYMLQGIQGQHLAEKVLQCFQEAVVDATIRAVRSLRLISLEGSYVDLCQGLPVELLRPCLVKQMAAVYDILASYHVMAQWHVDCLMQQQQQEQEAGAAATAAEGGNHNLLPAYDSLPFL